LGNAGLELQRRVEARMRQSNRWIWSDAAAAILAEDTDLAERFHAETRKGLTPR
jgi:hypothetical protein